MKNIARRFLSVLLVLSLCACLPVSAMAADPETNEDSSLAEISIDFGVEGNPLYEVSTSASEVYSNISSRIPTKKVRFIKTITCQYTIRAGERDYTGSINRGIFVFFLFKVKLIHDAGDHIHSLVQCGICGRIYIQHPDIALADDHKGLRRNGNTGTTAGAKTNVGTVRTAGSKAKGDLRHRDQRGSLWCSEGLSNDGVDVYHLTEFFHRQIHCFIDAAHEVCHLSLLSVEQLVWFSYKSSGTVTAR